MLLHQKLSESGYAMPMYDGKTDEYKFFIDEPSSVKRGSVPSELVDGMTVCRIADIRAEQKR